MFRAFRQIVLSLFVVCLSFVIFAVTSENGRYLGWLAQSVNQAREIRLSVSRSLHTVRDSVAEAFGTLSTLVNRAVAAETSKSVSSTEATHSDCDSQTKPTPARADDASVDGGSSSAKIQRLTAVLLWLFG